MTKFYNKDQGCLWPLIGWIATLLLKSVMLLYFWKWFVAEPFQLFEISFAHSIGLWSLISLLRYRHSEKGDTTIGIYVMEIVTNLLLLFGVGYLIKLLLL